MPVISATWAIGWLGFAVISGLAASARGREGAGWVLLGLLFGPLALIAVLVMPRNMGRIHVQCPTCQEWVQPEAKLCHYCRTALTPRVLPPITAEARFATRRASHTALAIVAGIILAAVIVLLARS